MLKDKVALVTGSGTGIGQAIALRFAAEGATLVLTGRTQSAIEDTAARIRNSGAKAYAFACDLSDENQVAQLYRKVLDAVGIVDILVNNAGASIEMPFANMPLSVWVDMMNNNLFTAVVITRVVLPDMIKKKAGCIVNISSGAGIRGLPGSTAYSASKAALIAFGQALGDEVRDYGLRVNTICPGPVDTDMLKNSTVRDYLLKSGAQLLEPEEIASAALYLSTEMSGKMNSQVLILRDKNRW